MDDSTKALTAVRKRQQIQNANRTMLIWVAIASAIVAVCIVLGYNFVQTIAYNNKVIGEKSKVNKVLKDNVTVIPQLKENVNKLQTNKNLLGLRADPNDTAFQVVIDALPTEDDRTALGSSLQERILVGSGVAIDQVSVTDTGAATTTTTAGAPADVQNIRFSFTVTGTYDSIAQAIKDIERTIRPINIDSMTLQGTSSQLQATINATTFYLPGVEFKLGSREVKP